ncbi:52 kDa repressor of the inhibitor of the protein kinase-like [Montipora foliosa]|uniref:52 kDa repressor of the inhibitor of the protein kinase-like n=1 Tax=Montipora foliosa TaxID=591990 RepID=UPI0035F1CE8C
MCVQGYDGASVMSGHVSGVQTRIRQVNPNAVYVNCQPHVLNLCIIHASKLPLVRNIMDTMQEVTLAFKFSAKRLLVFKEQLGDNPVAREEMGRRSKLKLLCETRWASRADCLSVFIDTFKSPNLDLIQASEEAKTCSSVLNAEKNDDAVWEALMEKAIEIASDYGIDPSSPRMAGRQQHRNNVPANIPSAYWKMAMYLPFLDHLVAEINEKLVVPVPGFQAQLLIPGKLGQLTAEKLKSIHEHYSVDMAIDLEEFKLEVNRWRHRWSIREPTDPLPQTLVEILDVANPAFYPAIYVAVKTLLTYPVSACAAECSFSSMKRLKTPLRNTMTDDRLSSLAILHIHKEKEINVESVLDQFAQHKERCLTLCL